MKSKKARSSSRSPLDKPNVTALLQSLQSQDLNVINRALEVIAQYLYSSTPQIKSNSSIIIAQVSHLLPALRAGIDSSLTHLKPHPLQSRVLEYSARVAIAFIHHCGLEMETLFPTHLMPVLLRSFASPDLDPSVDHVSYYA